MFTHTKEVTQCMILATMMIMRYDVIVKKTLNSLFIPSIRSHIDSIKIFQMQQSRALLRHLLETAIVDYNNKFCVLSGTLWLSLKNSNSIMSYVLVDVV